MTIDTIPTYLIKATGGKGQPVYMDRAGRFTNLEHEAAVTTSRRRASIWATSNNSISKITGLHFDIITIFEPSEVHNA